MNKKWKKLRRKEKGERKRESCAKVKKQLFNEAHSSIVTEARKLIVVTKQKALACITVILKCLLCPFLRLHLARLVAGTHPKRTDKKNNENDRSTHASTQRNRKRSLKRSREMDRVRYH